MASVAPPASERKFRCADHKTLNLCDGVRPVVCLPRFSILQAQRKFAHDCANLRLAVRGGGPDSKPLLRAGGRLRMFVDFINPVDPRRRAQERSTISSGRGRLWMSRSSVATLMSAVNSRSQKFIADATAEIWFRSEPLNCIERASASQYRIAVIRLGPANLEFAEVTARSPQPSDSLFMWWNFEIKSGGMEIGKGQYNRRPKSLYLNFRINFSRIFWKNFIPNATDQVGIQHTDS